MLCIVVLIHGCCLYIVCYDVLPEARLAGHPWYKLNIWPIPYDTVISTPDVMLLGYYRSILVTSWPLPKLSFLISHIWILPHSFPFTDHWSSAHSMLVIRVVSSAEIINRKWKHKSVTDWLCVSGSQSTNPGHPGPSQSL